MEITVLDGGMGGEIERRLKGTSHGLWSARALIDAPQTVVDIHREYIDAGARIIITNTYSTIPSYLGKENLQDSYIEMTCLGGKLARQAAEESNESVLVAGSIPPLSESYRPDLVPAAEAALPVYRNLVEALLPFVDLYICETMSSAAEALNAATQATRYGAGKPVYVAWTLNEIPGSGLRSGESIQQAFDILTGLDITGFMFNCARPEAIEQALRELRSLTTKPLGCYANRTDSVPEGWTLDNDIQVRQRTDMTTDYFVETCLRCADAGASIIGGCCGIGPADIKALANTVAQMQR